MEDIALTRTCVSAKTIDQKVSRQATPFCFSNLLLTYLDGNLDG